MALDMMKLRHRILMSTPHLETKSGAIASFNTDMAIPLTSLVANIEPAQSGSGDPSPANIRPISGWSKAKITRVGKNLLDPNRTIDATATTVATMLTAYKASGVYGKGYYNGTAINTNAQFFTTFTPCKAGETYTIRNTVDTFSRVCFLDDDGNVITISNGWVTTYTHTASSNEKYIMASFKIANIDYVQLELGSTATGYEAFAGNTYTIDLDGTRYGGTLDVLTGVLTVTKRYFVADGVNIKTTGGYGASGPKWLPCITLSAADYGVWDTMKTSYLKTKPPTLNVQNDQNTADFGNSAHVIVLHIGTMQGTDGTHGYNSANEVHAAVNAYLQSNPLEVCYTLLTPFTVQLTAQQIHALKGANNIWANTGDVDVTYWTH